MDGFFRSYIPYYKYITHPYFYYWNSFYQTYYKSPHYFSNGYKNHFYQEYQKCIRRCYCKRQNTEQKYLNCILQCMKSAGYNTIEIIVLPENTTTGFMWHYNIENESIIQVVDNGYEEFEHEEGMLGVGGIHTWTIKPLKKGTTKIKFELSRDWVSNEVYEKKEYIVTVYSTTKNGPLFIKIKEEYL